MARKVVTVAVDDLRPHPLNRELYDRPQDNDAFENILFTMRRGGFDDTHPLLVTADGRIISGVTRWATARKAGIAQVPCVTFVPKDPETAELEVEQKLIEENYQRARTELMKARECRKKVQIEQQLAKKRMAHGNTDGGESKSTDRVGAFYKRSGRTVLRMIKALEAIEAAQAAGDRKLADRMTDLLERGKPGKVVGLAGGKAKGKPARAEPPVTLLSKATQAVSAWESACHLATCKGELEQLMAYEKQMGECLARRVGHVMAPPPGPAPAGRGKK
jgi:hypothetical protein